MGALDDYPAATHTASVGFPFYFDDTEGITWGTLYIHPTWFLPYDLMIYYGLMGSSDFVGGWCSRWDVQNYSLTCETWLNKADTQSLMENIIPGATGELYQILGKPNYYDKTWTASNTIKVKSHPSSNLKNMRSEKIVYVKNVTTHPITSTDWIEIKLECNISGNQDI